MVRVLLISNHSIFGQGLKSLLAQEDLDLVAHVVDTEDIIPYVESLRPDVLVLVCGARRQDPSPALMHCLRDGLVQKIVTVSLEDNALCVYNGHQSTVETIDDLLSEVRQPV
jgi:DNA-binding NarL/FixJ family response regulator